MTSLALPPDASPTMLEPLVCRKGLFEPFKAASKVSTAARWSLLAALMTASAFEACSVSMPASSRVPITGVMPRAVISAACSALRTRPVTVWPALTRPVAMEPPIKPAAPVTNTFMECAPDWVSDASSIEDSSLSNKTLLPNSILRTGHESAGIPRQLGLNEVQETLDAQRQLRVAIEHCVDRLAITTVKRLQHRHQPPGIDVFDRHEVRQAANALPFQRQLAQGFATGGGDARLDQPTVAFHMAQRPMVKGFGLGETQQCMVRQLGHRRGRAVLLDVVGAGEDMQRRTAQRTGMQRGVGQGADTDGNVGALLQQVDDQVIAVQLQLDFRVEAAKLGDVRHDPVQHERHGGVDAQPPGRVFLA